MGQDLDNRQQTPLTEARKEELLRKANLPGGRVKIDDVVEFRKETYPKEQQKEIRDALDALEISETGQQVLKEILKNPHITTMPQAIHKREFGMFGPESTCFKPGLNELRIIPEDKNSHFYLSPDGKEVKSSELALRPTIAHEFQHVADNLPVEQRAKYDFAAEACEEEKAIKRENQWRTEHGGHEPLRQIYSFGNLDNLFSEYQSGVIDRETRQFHKDYPERDYNLVKNALRENGGCSPPLSEEEVHRRATKGAELVRKVYSEDRLPTQEELVAYYNLLNPKNS